MYCLIGCVGCVRTVLEESNYISTFTGSVAEIIDAYPEYTSFYVVNAFSPIVFSF